LQVNARDHEGDLREVLPAVEIDGAARHEDTGCVAVGRNAVAVRRSKSCPALKGDVDVVVLGFRRADANRPIETHEPKGHSTRCQSIEFKVQVIGPGEGRELDWQECVTEYGLGLVGAVG
jgi:hypothetical protein